LRNNKNELREQITTLRSEIGNLGNQIDEQKRVIKTNENLITRKRSELAQVKVDYTNAKKTEFKPLEAHHCPNCDFDLTAEENEKKEISSILIKLMSLKASHQKVTAL